MAVTSWTDNDSNGVAMEWSNPNPKDTHYFDALFEAIRERHLCLSPTLWNYYVYPQKLFNLDSCFKQQAIFRIFYLIENICHDSINFFVNHDDNSGDWSGESTIPLWNAKTLGNSTETSTLKTTYDKYFINDEKIKEFFVHCYKTLNKMKWVRLSHGIPDYYGRNAVEHTKHLFLDYCYLNHSYLWYTHPMIEGLRKIDSDTYENRDDYTDYRVRVYLEKSFYNSVHYFRVNIKNPEYSFMIGNHSNKNASIDCDVYFSMNVSASNNNQSIDPTTIVSDVTILSGLMKVATITTSLDAREHKRITIPSFIKSTQEYYDDITSESLPNLTNQYSKIVYSAYYTPAYVVVKNDNVLSFIDW